MAYDGNSVQGIVPEVGAIFMSNGATKKECLRRKLLGLPAAQANFVKQVKTGMILFLFEFEKRELYGVYRASSNGAMNLVPRAFSSSGSKFPAQVHFTQVWYCDPLSENEFRGAIKDNYFSGKKFNFGLSQDQVYSLLRLFSTRKLKCHQPERGLTRYTTRNDKLEKIIRADCGLVQSAEVSSDRQFTERRREADDCHFSIDNGYNGNFAVSRKIRRATDDDDNKFNMSSSILGNENSGDRHHGPLISADFYGNPFDNVRRATDDGFSMNDHLENGYATNGGNRTSVGPGGVTESRDMVENARLSGNSIVRFSAPTEGSRFMSNRVDNACNMVNGYMGYALGSGVAANNGGSMSNKLDDNTLINSTGPNTFSGSIKPNLETDYSPFQNRLGYSSTLPSFFSELKRSELSYPTPQDAVVTRSVPYDPDLPYKIDNNSNLLQEYPHCSSSDKSYLPKCLSRFQDYEDRSSYRTSNSSLSYANGDCEGYLSLEPSGPSLSYMQSPKGEAQKQEIAGTSFTLGSCNNLSSGYVISSDIYERNLSDEIVSWRSSERTYAESENKRTSVFARLTAAPVASQLEDDKTFDTDESVEEVMEKLLQNRSFQAKKGSKSRPLDRQHNYYDEISKTKERETTVCSEMDYADMSMVSDDEDGGQTVVETRHVGFKRRSEINKLKDGIEKRENEGSAKKSKHRKKLIRPAFTKEESPREEDVGIGKIQNSGIDSFEAPSRILRSEIDTENVCKKSEDCEEQSSGIVSFDMTSRSLGAEVGTENICIKSEDSGGNCELGDFISLTVIPENVKIEEDRESNEEVNNENGIYPTSNIVER